MNGLKALAVGTIVAGALLAQQESASAQVVLGAKVGATFSNISEDPDELDTSSLTSFGGGGFLRFALGGVGLQVEVLALTKGTKFDDPDSDDSVKLKLDYIEVPLLLRLGLGSGASFTPYLMAGPSVGFEIGCSFDVDSDIGGGSLDCDDTDTDAFERSKTDIGLTGVLGFEFAAGPGNILVEGRYTHGLTDLAKEADVKSKNRSFGIFAGYAVPLGSR